MLGHLMEWFYTGLGGISQQENSVAFKEILIKPEMVGDVRFAKTSFNSPYGTINCDWEKLESSTVIKIEIPANASALVYLPVDESSIILESGNPLEKISDVKVLKKEKGKLICRIGSGKYFFRVNN